MGDVVGRGAAGGPRRDHRDLRDRRHPSGRRPRGAFLVLVCALGGIGVACSDTEISSSSPDGGQVVIGDLPRPSVAATETSVPGEATGAGAVPTAGPEGTAATDATAPVVTDATGAAVVPSVPGATTSPTTPGATGTTIAPVSAAPGVPGVDSSNVICASWARLAGTRQVLTAAANLGGLDDVQLARLEVVSASFVLEAIQRLDGGLEEVGGDVWAERDVVMEELLGRVEGRADAALTALTELAPPDGTAALLSQVWLDALRRLDPSSPLPPLADLGPELGSLVDRAAATAAVDAPRWNDDIALDVSGVEVPATAAFLDRSCPDLSALGIGDAV